jgi:hypothetical protein
VNRPISQRRFHIALIVVLIVVVLAGGLALYLHVAARTRFAEVKDAVGQIQVQVPAGAVLLTESGIGDGLSAYTCIDTHCPAYGRAYAVGISPGSEMATVRQLIESAGHYVTASSEDSCVSRGDTHPVCYAESRSSGLLLTVGLEQATNEWNDWVPEQPPPSGTQWRRLTISASNY